jgi:hypothetical protein
VAVWANGVLANYGGDPQCAPNSAAVASIITIVASLGLGVAGLAIR